VIPITAIHRDPDLWPQPDDFRPQRWEGYPSHPLPENPAVRVPCSFMPFSVGPRNCVGERFALQEAKLILAVLLQRLRFEADPSYVHAPAMLITLRPSLGMPMRVFARG
jgi:cytochrome P450